MKQFESVGAWIAASDSDTEALLKRVVADIAADQLKEARLRRRQRLRRSTILQTAAYGTLTDRH